MCAHVHAGACERVVITEDRLLLPLVAWDLCDLCYSSSRADQGGSLGCRTVASWFAGVHQEPLCFGVSWEHPLCASTLKVRKLRSDGVPVLGQGRACARRAVPKNVCSDNLPICHRTHHWIGLQGGHSPEEHDAQSHAHRTCPSDSRVMATFCKGVELGWTIHLRLCRRVPQSVLGPQAAAAPDNSYVPNNWALPRSISVHQRLFGPDVCWWIRPNALVALCLFPCGRLAGLPKRFWGCLTAAFPKYWGMSRDTHCSTSQDPTGSGLLPSDLQAVSMKLKNVDTSVICRYCKSTPVAFRHGLLWSHTRLHPLLTAEVSVPMSLPHAGALRQDWWTLLHANP